MASVLMKSKNYSGVPQGSIIGPILFILYRSPVHKLLDEFNIPFPFYADDSQFMFEFDDKIDEINISMTIIFDEIDSLQLKVKHDKTDVNFFVSKRSKICCPKTIDILGNTLPVKDTITLFGATMDKHLTFEPQIDKECRQCYLQLRKLYSTQKFLGFEQ